MNLHFIELMLYFTNSPNFEYFSRVQMPTVARKQPILP